MTARKPPEQHGKDGPKPKFRLNMLPRIKKMAAAGMTEHQITIALDICDRTLSSWKTEYPKLLQALTPGKRVANRRVEMALYHRAVGYSCPDTHIAVIEGKVVITPIVKHYPPSEGAITLWLTNREKKKWKNRQSQELSTPDGKPLQFESLPPEPDLIGKYYERLAQIAADRASRRPAKGVGAAAVPEDPDDPGDLSGG